MSEMKNYIALYRRYRPKSFDDVVGQDDIVRALKNQIKHKRISHAYIFSGTRGTGKTTLARIFTKALNCLSDSVDVPCGKCESCTKDFDFDVYELDAASNNGAGDIKMIVDSARYVAGESKYKVYIIDEVHMLSTEAFNALLKTLEEPPENVIFILATTELHKIPATIQSRCMRFDFKLVSSEMIAKRLEKIFIEIGIDYEKDAVQIIAECAQGSVRDALSLAETALAYTNNSLKTDDVSKFLGLSSPHKIVAFLSYILNGDYTSMLLEFKNMMLTGKSPQTLITELLTMLSKLIFVKNCSNAKQIYGLSDGLYMSLLEINASNKKIAEVMQIISSVEVDLRSSKSAELILESSLIKACDKEARLDISSLLFKIRKIEEQFKNHNNEDMENARYYQGAKTARALILKLDEKPEAKLLSKILKDQRLSDTYVLDGVLYFKVESVDSLNAINVSAINRAMLNEAIDANLKIHDVKAEYSEAYKQEIEIANLGKAFPGKIDKKD